jgi:hypothetical protein
MYFFDLYIYLYPILFLKYQMIELILKENIPYLFCSNDPQHEKKIE